MFIYFMITNKNLNKKIFKLKKSESYQSKRW